MAKLKEGAIMKTIRAKKHWLYWFVPVSVSLLITFLIVASIYILHINNIDGFVLLWLMMIPTLILFCYWLRWRFDTIEVKDGCLYSRIGILKIKKEIIPLEKISYLSENTNLIGQLIKCGSLVIQSSADGKEIVYPLIYNPSEFIKKVNQFNNLLTSKKIRRSI